MQHPSGLLTIDLSAIQGNWLQLRQMLASGAECGAVVKADGYGLGMAPVARALQKAGCRSFFVVTLSEGVALRRALAAETAVDADIYLLRGVQLGAEHQCVAAGLIPVLINYPMAQRWLAWCKTAQVPQAQRRSAIKINTGMNRLGLEPDELMTLAAVPGCLADLGCELLLSHLACADQAGHPLNNHQLTLFETLLTRCRQELPGVRASLANSAATQQGERWHFDLVRPGISLYGGNPTGLPRHQMRPVVRLQLPVVQSRVVQPGSAIGYGAAYVSDSERHLATIAGGYGDGLFRSMGNHGQVWFKQALPIVGRVSMDSFVVDVTDIPPAERPVEGDTVECLGPHWDIDAAAQAAGTISYEILTRLTGRYERCYLLDGYLQDKQIVDMAL